MSNVIEIFSSIQGEGKYVGCRQIFIRTADCNLKCAYCDTNFARADFCNVETFAGSMKFKQIKNPIGVGTVADIVKKFMAEVPTHSISFTGGEPLLHWQFIRAVAEEINAKIFLETNGTLYKELEEVIDVVDIISMDIKLPSVAGNNFEKHREFMKVAAGKDLYVKIVISAETLTEEYEEAIEMIPAGILLILQPVTPVRNIGAISARKILEFQEYAVRKIKDVRVIPQTHRLINIF